MQIDITLITPQGERTFSCFAHRTEDQSNRLIEREYYERWCPGAIPQGVHHELELLTEVTERPPSARLHIHIHPSNGKKFVCWTGSLPTIEVARTLFKMWCVGTTYCILNDRDFTEFYTGNTADFLTMMERD